MNSWENGRQTKTGCYTENTHRENERQEETEIQKGTAVQNKSERGRKVGKARAQKEVKGTNEENSHGKGIFPELSSWGRSHTPSF